MEVHFKQGKLPFDKQNFIRLNKVSKNRIKVD